MAVCTFELGTPFLEGARVFAIVSCTLFSFVVWPQLRPIHCCAQVLADVAIYIRVPRSTDDSLVSDLSQ